MMKVDKFTVIAMVFLDLRSSGFCCCEPGHLPFILSCNKALSSRWLAWEVVSSSYTVHGYSISENQAHLVFNSYDYKRNYITNYVKVIFENIHFLACHISLLGTVYHLSTD